MDVSGGRIRSADSCGMTDAYKKRVGVAEGSIMPIIITAHIAKSSTWSVKSQVRVIIHADEPVYTNFRKGVDCFPILHNMLLQSNHNIIRTKK
jgi:hypothetical protein